MNRFLYLKNVLLSFVATVLLMNSPVLNAALFGMDTTTGDLVKLDTSSGAATTIGNTGFFDINSLAFVGDTLYGVSVRGADRLVTIDTATAQVTEVGQIGFGGVESLAYDSASNTLFAVSESTLLNQLLVIDPSTGAGFEVGDIGFPDLRGLAFGNDTLFGWDTGADQLVSIDTATGIGSLIGSAPGVGAIESLAYGNNTLFAVDFASDELVTIDPITAAISVVGATGTQSIQGLAFQSAVVPLPAALPLLMFGLAALGIVGCRKQMPRIGADGSDQRN